MWILLPLITRSAYNVTTPRLNVDIYQAIIRPLLFSGLRTDPEWLHQQTMQALSWLEGRDRPTASWTQRRLQQSLCVQDPRLAQTLWGLQFPNPIGLAAGFDKEGIAAPLWSILGFGFAELGTVTLQPQPGNPRPRLFRLPQDKAALNRMGFNNSGAAAMAARLANQNRGIQPTPVGINLGKSKVAPLEVAAADYLGSFRLLKDWADYFVVNVSSPNTPGLRSLQEATQLGTILDALQQENQGQKPIFVKIAPDLTWEAIADILAISQTYQMAGIVATNTTVSREGLRTQFIPSTGIPRWRRQASDGSFSDRKIGPLDVHREPGGISGAPLRDRSTEVIRFIRQQTQGQLPIIGVGGIFTADDAWEKITAGASLIQVYTGWIYEGPWMVRRILEGLLQKLAEHELSSITEAIGKGHRA